MSRHADLCQYDLPNGKLCRQVALKNEQLCRHHRRFVRHTDEQCSRSMAEEIFSAQLTQMDTPTLLHTLEQKLRRIEYATPAHSEARLTLQAALNRLEQQREAAASLNPNDFQKLFENFMESMT